MNVQFAVFFFLLVAIIFYSIKKDKLTIKGVITAALVGCLVFLGFGLKGIALMGTFFLLGNLATSWKIGTKARLGAAEHQGGQRDASQVLANGGVAALLGILASLFPSYHLLFFLMMASSLSSATADTLSSELGTLYGRGFYNILSFRKDRRGENGVISLEGTLFGIAGSAIIALIHAFTTSWNAGFLVIIIAGTIGNLADSILGATLERKNIIKNDVVNFSNTALAALAGGAISLIM